MQRAHHLVEQRVDPFTEQPQRRDTSPSNCVKICDSSSRPSIVAWLAEMSSSNQAPVASHYETDPWTIKWSGAITSPIKGPAHHPGHANGQTQRDLVGIDHRIGDQASRLHSRLLMADAVNRKSPCATLLLQEALDTPAARKDTPIDPPTTERCERRHRPTWHVTECSRQSCPAAVLRSTLRSCSPLAHYSTNVKLLLRKSSLSLTRKIASASKAPVKCWCLR